MFPLREKFGERSALSCAGSRVCINHPPGANLRRAAGRQDSDGADVRGALRALEVGIKDLQRSLDAHRGDMSRHQRSNEDRLTAIEACLRAMGGGAAGGGCQSPGPAAAGAAGAAADAERSDQDRKRIKERLKEALELHKEREQNDRVERAGLAEYLFGICKPHGRIGKTGSRWARARLAGGAVARRGPLRAPPLPSSALVLCSASLVTSGRLR